MNGMWKFVILFILEFMALVEISESLCQKEFFTRFDDSIGSFGHMFNIRKKEGGDEILLTGLDIYTDVTKELYYKLYTREGSYLDALTDIAGWDKISEGLFTGKGGSDPTPLPLFENKIKLAPGDVRGFYVTLTTPDLRYRYGAGGGGDKEIQQENNYLQIWEGTGILVYPLASTSAGPRMFLGVIRYETHQECSSGGNDDDNENPVPSPTDAPDLNLKTTAVPFTFLVKHSVSIPLIQVVNGINSDVEVSIQTLLSVDKDLSGYVENYSLKLLGAKSFLVPDPSFAVNCDNIFDDDTICSVIETVVGLSHTSYVQQSTIRDKLMSTGATMSNFFSYESEYIGKTSVEEDVEVKIFNASREMTRNEQAIFVQEMLSFLGPRLNNDDVVLESIAIKGQEMSTVSIERRAVEVARDIPEGLRNRGYEIVKYHDRSLGDVSLLTITLSVRAQHLPPPSLESIVQSAIENDSVALLLALQISSIRSFFTDASFNEPVITDDDNDDNDGDDSTIPEESNPESGDSANVAAIVVPMILLFFGGGLAAYYFLNRDKFSGKFFGDKILGMRIGRGEDKTSVRSDESLHEKEHLKSREERSDHKRRRGTDQKEGSERSKSNRRRRGEGGRSERDRDRADHKGSDHHRRREGERSERDSDRGDHKGSDHHRRREGGRSERDRDRRYYKGSDHHRRGEGGRSERDRDRGDHKGSDHHRRREGGRSEHDRDRSGYKGSDHHRRREGGRSEHDRDRSDYKGSDHHRRRGEGRSERSRRRDPTRDRSRLRRAQSDYDSDGDAVARSRRTRSSSPSRRRQEMEDRDAPRKSSRPEENEAFQDEEIAGYLVDHKRRESGSDHRKEGGNRISRRGDSRDEEREGGSGRRKEMRRKDDRKSNGESDENYKSHDSLDEDKGRQKERRSSSDLLNASSAHPRLEGQSDKKKRSIRETKSSHGRNLGESLQSESKPQEQTPANPNRDVNHELSRSDKSDQQKSSNKNASEREGANDSLSGSETGDRHATTPASADDALDGDEFSTDIDQDTRQEQTLNLEDESAQEIVQDQETEANSDDGNSENDHEKETPGTFEGSSKDEKEDSVARTNTDNQEEEKELEDSNEDDRSYEEQEEDHSCDSSAVKKNDSPSEPKSAEHETISLPDIDHMKGKEMRTELESYGVPTDFLVEKAEFKEALGKAREEKERGQEPYPAEEAKEPEEGRGLHETNANEMEDFEDEYFEAKQGEDGEEETRATPSAASKKVNEDKKVPPSNEQQEEEELQPGIENITGQPEEGKIVDTKRPKNTITEDESIKGIGYPVEGGETEIFEDEPEEDLVASRRSSRNGNERHDKRRIRGVSGDERSDFVEEAASNHDRTNKFESSAHRRRSNNSRQDDRTRRREGESSSRSQRRRPPTRERKPDGVSHPRQRSSGGTGSEDAAFKGSTEQARRDRNDSRRRRRGDDDDEPDPRQSNRRSGARSRQALDQDRTLNSSRHRSSRGEQRSSNRSYRNRRSSGGYHRNGDKSPDHKPATQSQHQDEFDLLD